MSRIVGGIKANTSEQPHAGYSSRLKFDVTIPVADGSPMSIPKKKKKKFVLNYNRLF
jgi:hypothetical protein